MRVKVKKILYIILGCIGVGLGAVGGGRKSDIQLYERADSVH